MRTCEVRNLIHIPYSPGVSLIGAHVPRLSCAPLPHLATSAPRLHHTSSPSFIRNGSSSPSLPFVSRGPAPICSLSLPRARSCPAPAPAPDTRACPCSVEAVATACRRNRHASTASSSLFAPGPTTPLPPLPGLLADLPSLHPHPPAKVLT
jgi:hypothetical protein